MMPSRRRAHLGTGIPWEPPDAFGGGRLSRIQLDHADERPRPVKRATGTGSSRPKPSTRGTDCGRRRALSRATRPCQQGRPSQQRASSRLSPTLSWRPLPSPVRCPSWARVHSRTASTRLHARLHAHQTPNAKRTRGQRRQTVLGLAARAGSSPTYPAAPARGSMATRRAYARAAAVAHAASMASRLADCATVVSPPRPFATTPSGRAPRAGRRASEARASTRCTALRLRRRHHRPRRARRRRRRRRRPHRRG